MPLKLPPKNASQCPRCNLISLINVAVFNDVSVHGYDRILLYVRKVFGVHGLDSLERLVRCLGREAPIHDQ